MTKYKEFIVNKLPQPQQFEEVFAFSVHKAGSTLMHNMIAQVCRRSEISSISIPDRMFLEGFSDEWQNDSEMCELFTPGRVYYGYRPLPTFMIDEKFKLHEKRAVLLIRDPRDALVSQYFSLGGKYISHRVPNKNKEAFLDRLRKTADLDINQYVLQAARDYLGKLSLYRSSLSFANVLLRRYESIFMDKQTFLAEIFEHFGLTLARYCILDIECEL